VPRERYKVWDENKWDGKGRTSRRRVKKGFKFPEKWASNLIEQQRKERKDRGEKELKTKERDKNLADGIVARGWGGGFQ